MSESKELKPCFCGSKNIRAEEILMPLVCQEFMVAYCPDCKLQWEPQSYIGAWNEQKLVDAWNEHRAPIYTREAELEREVERLQSKLDYLEDILPCDLDEMLEEDNDSTN